MTQNGKSTGGDQSPPTGHGSSGQANHDPDLESLLAGLLGKLVAKHGREGAALELGVTPKTLRKAFAEGRLTDKVRIALERHWYLLKGASLPDSPVVARLKALEERLASVEERASVQGDLVGRTGAEVAAFRSELAGRVAKLEHAVEGLATDVRDLNTKVERLAQSQAPPPPTLTPRTSSVTIPPSGTASTSGQSGRVAPPSKEQKKEALWKEWETARAAEVAAPTKLDRAIAEERRYEIEIELIHDFDETVPRGELWGSVVKSREFKRRWDLLEDTRRDRRRYERRRCFRRVLTLGLWRS